MDLVDFAKKHIEAAREMFEALGYATALPMLHIRKHGYDDVVVTVSGPVPQGGLYEAIQEILSMLPFVPDSIMVISDSYCIKNPDAEYVESVKNGTNHSLETMFKLGDLRVKEACNVTLMCEEALVTISQPYKWTPVDGWEWEEMEILDSRDGYSATDWDFNRIINNMPRPSVIELWEG